MTTETSEAITAEAFVVTRDLLAYAIHRTYPDLREFRECSHEPNYGDGRTECQYDADALAVVLREAAVR